MGTERTIKDALTIHIDGAPSDGGDVRLSIFVNKLDEFRAALQEADKYLYGINKNTVDFLVSNLTHNSPAAVSIQMQPNGDPLVHQDQIFTYLSELIAEITSGKYRAASASYYLLTKLNELTSGVGDKFSKMWLSYKNEVAAVISIETQVNLRALLAKQYTSIGTIKGKMEIYHGHGKEKFFYVYPLVGERVKCVFGDSHTEIASRAVEQTVTVVGSLKYLEGEFFPSEVCVQSIEINPPNEELDTLSGLLGVVNKAGDNTELSVDVIKRIRDGWH